MKWERKKLSEFCLSISDGDHQPPPKTDTGIPFITISNITSTSDIDFSNTMFVSKEYYDNIDNKRKAQKNDILYSVVGSFGIPVYIKETIPFVFQRHIAILRVDETIILPRYLYYVMKSRDFYMQADSVALGAAQRTISLTSLRNMKIELPPIEIQNKIVNILFAYDDLIENNQKQIKLLEEAAQRLYKEWFVDLRFPGHEKVKIIDGVPEGWKFKSIGDMECKIESGKRPKGGIDLTLKKGIASIGAENVIGLGKYNFSDEKMISPEFYDSMTKGKLVNKDILIYKDGAYIGKTTLFQDGFPHAKAAVNEHVFLLHMNDDILQYYIFFTLYQQTYYNKMQKLNNNAAQPGINIKGIQSLNIMLPEQKIVNKFDNLISPLVKNIFICSKQIRYLSDARDRLLPKLMNGEIEV